MKDPNYDSDLLDDDNIVLREITPESSDEELKVIILYISYTMSGGLLVIFMGVKK